MGLLNNTENSIPAENSGLQPGIILDGRYEVIRLIGEGGFGLTYEAVNRHTGQHTAIKEHKEGNHEIILREARVLKDFSDDPAIVTILDSFIENGKSYLVMEYLDGQTLAQEIKTKGKWNTEKTVRSFVPVMKAIKRMHEAGVIHRDISPDNLMVRPDGSLVLMDFGAAKDFAANNYTQTSVYKSVYSPPEQRDTGVTLGSYTDIYALCATLYFCITGTEPEDAFSRLLFDELKKPSEIGSDILPPAEKTLLKGMELACEDRLQSVEELRSELEAVYPDLSEEEKKAALERKRRRKRVLWSVCCAALAAVLCILYVYRVQIRFAFIDTQEAMFDGEHLSDDEFREQADGVLARVRAFAGRDNYLWQEQGKRIRVVVPSDLFGESDPQNYIRLTLTRPMVLSIDIDETTSQGIFSPGEDIRTVERVDDGMRIIFTDEGAKRLGKTLDSENVKIRLVFDKDKNYSPQSVYSGITLGDGISVLVKSPDKAFYPIPDELFKLHFTQEPLKNSFYVQSEWKVRWENPDETLFPGKNQYNPEEIPGKTFSVKLSWKSSNDKNSYDGYDGNELSSQAIIKNRLDSLETPYAIGINQFTKNDYVIKLPINSVYKEELDLLGDGYFYQRFDIGSQSTYSGDYSFYSDFFTIETNPDERFSFVLHSHEYSHEKLSKILQTIQEQDGDTVYLYYSDKKIAECPLTEAIVSFESDGTIPFSRWSSPAHPKMDSSTHHFAKFIVCGLQQDPEFEYKANDGIFEVRDETGNIIYFDYDEIIPKNEFDNPLVDDYVSEWKNEYKDRIYFYKSYTLGDLEYLDVRIPWVELDDPAKALSDFEDFIHQYEKVLTDGTFRRINLWLSSTNSSKDPNTEISLRMDFDSGKMQLDMSSAGDEWWISGSNIELFRSYILSSPRWAPYVPEVLKSAGN